jgi:KDO2-lipid IV(A) lauroyltransferase
LGQRSEFRNRFEAALAGGIVASLRHSPRPMADWLGARYANLLDTLVRRLRQSARINLQFAYPDRDEAWRESTIDGVYRSIGRVLVAFAKLPDIDRSNVGDWIRYEGFEHYQRAKALGRGVLFATGHLGNWELSAYAHALLTEPMGVVVRPLDNPVLDEMVEARRALSGNTALSKRDFARSILRLLKDNKPVGILVDHNSAHDNAVFVPFFGKPACTNLTFARLAARSGAPVIPGFAFWSDGERKYVLRFYPPVEITGDAPEDTARIQAAIESAIREHPDQWLWVHRRWKTRPDGERPLY